MEPYSCLGEAPLGRGEQLLYLFFTKDILGTRTSCDEHRVQLEPFKKHFIDNHTGNKSWEVYGRCPECGSERPILEAADTVVGRAPIPFLGADNYAEGGWDDGFG